MSCNLTQVDDCAALVTDLDHVVFCGDSSLINSFLLPFRACVAFRFVFSVFNQRNLLVDLLIRLLITLYRMVSGLIA